MYFQNILMKEIPIIKAYLKYKNDESIKKIQNIYLINSFENQLLPEYSFNILRKEEKQKNKRYIRRKRKVKN